MTSRNIDHLIMDEDQLLRKEIVEMILDKSSFNGLTGKTIAEYGLEIEAFILHGEKIKHENNKIEEWRKRSI